MDMAKEKRRLRQDLAGGGPSSQELRPEVGLSG